MKIDFVIPWVDGADKEWLKEKAKYDNSTVTTSNSEVRYRDWDNLEYWFRAVEKYAPWVNKIHFVTYGHLPTWLDVNNEKLNIVKHEDFIPREFLPTFSSHTIELNLHRIKGLSEHFVYFNDDIFLNSPTRQEDFFKNGLPLDTAAQNCIFFGKDSAGFFHGADILVINTHFRKRICIAKNLGKWLCYKNGLHNVVKTLFLYPWPWFPGMYLQHVAASYLKSTFHKVWEAEPEMLNKTCSHKFREIGDVNQWVMKFWQLAEGNFCVRKDSFARCYHIKKSTFRRMCRDLKSGIHPLICINDTARTYHFEEKKKIVNEILQKRFPEKSSFEK